MHDVTLSRRVIILLVLGSLAFFLGLRLYLLYWGILAHNPIIPPGDDPAIHLQILHEIAEGTFAAGTYPTGYHVILQQLVRLSGWPAVTMMALTAPLLVAGVVIGGFSLSASWFGWRPALTTAALLALAASAPILGFMDGNYPNLLAGGLFLPIGFLFFMRAFRREPVFNSLIANLFFLAIAATHHLTYGLVLLIVPSFLLLLFILERIRMLVLPNRNTVTLIILFGFVATFLVALRGAGISVFMPILRDFIQGQASGFLSSLDQTPITWPQYADVLGGAVWFSGLIGLAWLVTQKNIHFEQRMFLLLWTGVVFLCSRTELSGLPARFARELTIPLATSGGLLLADVVQQVKYRAGRIALAGAMIFILTSSAVMLTQDPAQLPDGLNRMLWFNATDIEKLAAIQELPLGSRIISTPSSRYYEVLLTGRTLSVLPADVLGDSARIAQTIMEKADYLFISDLPSGNAEIRTYPYFSNYDEIRTTLEKYDHVQTVRVFPDGSEIRKVIVH